MASAGTTPQSARAGRPNVVARRAVETRLQRTTWHGARFSSVRKECIDLGVPENAFERFNAWERSGESLRITGEDCTNTGSAGAPGWRSRRLRPASAACPPGHLGAGLGAKSPLAASLLLQGGYDDEEGWGKSAARSAVPDSSIHDALATLRHAGSNPGLCSGAHAGAWSWPFSPFSKRGSFVGILEQRAASFVESLRDVDAATVLVEVAMSADVYVVHPDTPLTAVAHSMAEHKYDCAVIVDRPTSSVFLRRSTHCVRSSPSRRPRPTWLTRLWSEQDPSRYVSCLGARPCCPLARAPRATCATIPARHANGAARFAARAFANSSQTGPTPVKGMVVA